MIDGGLVGKRMLEVQPKLLSLVCPGGTVANPSRALGRRGCDVIRWCHPTSMPFFSNHPVEPPLFIIAMDHGLRKKRRRMAHVVPFVAAAHVAQPFSQWSTRSTSLLWRGIKDDDVGCCVEQMAKVVTPPANRQVRLEHAQFQLRLGIQPGNDRGSHGPRINIEAGEDEKIRLTAQRILGGHHVDVARSWMKGAHRHGRSDVFQQLDKPSPVGWYGKVETAHGAGRGAQPLHQGLKCSKTQIVRRSTLGENIVIHAGEQPNQPCAPVDRLGGQGQHFTGAAPLDRGVQQMLVLTRKQRSPCVQEACHPPLGFFQGFAFLFGATLGEGRTCLRKDTQPSSHGTRSTKHVKLTRNLFENFRMNSRYPILLGRMGKVRKHGCTERNCCRSKQTLERRL